MANACDVFGTGFERHGHGRLGNQFTGLRADDVHPQYFIGGCVSQHFDHAGGVAQRARTAGFRSLWRIHTVPSTASAASAHHHLFTNVPTTITTCVGSGSARPACANVCSNGACAGSCPPGDVQCNGTTPQSCDASGAWVIAPTLEWTNRFVDGLAPAKRGGLFGFVDREGRWVAEPRWKSTQPFFTDGVAWVQLL